MVLGAMPDAEWLAEGAASLRRRQVATRVQPLPVYAGAAIETVNSLASAKAS